MVHKKQALPIALTVVKGNKTHFFEEGDVALMEEIHRLTPEGAVLCSAAAGVSSPAAAVGAGRRAE